MFLRNLRIIGKTVWDEEKKQPKKISGAYIGRITEVGLVPPKKKLVSSEAAVDMSFTPLEFEKVKNQIKEMNAMNMTDAREEAIRLWFAMWLRREDLGIGSLFSPDAIYIESWGPEYHGAAKIAHWFEEWNTRGKVLRWDIHEFFHKGDQTVVQWTFACEMKGSPADTFDGMSLVRFTPEGKMDFLQEFGCNLRRYDPYAAGGAPVFRDEAVAWF